MIVRMIKDGISKPAIVMDEDRDVVRHIRRYIFGGNKDLLNIAFKSKASIKGRHTMPDSDHIEVEYDNGEIVRSVVKRAGQLY